MKEFTIEELKTVINKHGFKERYDLITYLIGYNGVVTAHDYENINALRKQKVIGK